MSDLELLTQIFVAACLIVSFALGFLAGQQR